MFQKFLRNKKTAAIAAAIVLAGASAMGYAYVQGGSLFSAAPGELQSLLSQAQAQTAPAPTASPAPQAAPALESPVSTAIQQTAEAPTPTRSQGADEAPAAPAPVASAPPATPLPAFIPTSSQSAPKATQKTRLAGNRVITSCSVATDDMCR